MTDIANSGPEATFRAYLTEGRFMIQRSRKSGTYVFYPRIAAPGSGETDLEWVEASGEGTVYSTTVVHNRPEKGGDYNVALIDLAEGPRMMSRVVDIDPADVKIGMKVRAQIREFESTTQILFAPA